MKNTKFTKAVVFTLKDKAQEIRNAIVENSDTFAMYKFSTCSATQKKSIGFSRTVFGEFVHTDAKGDIHMVYTHQSKTPNPNEVNFHLDVNVVKWKTEAELAGKEPNEDGELLPSKRELKELKELAEYNVLQTTFPKEEKHVPIVITKDGTVIVGENYKIAEDALSLIRKALGSLPCFPVIPETPVADLLDDWIAKAVNDKITLGEKATFYTQADGKVTVSGESIDSDECRKLLKDGMMPTAVEVNYDGVLDCLLRDTLVFDSLKFSSELQDQAEGDEQGSFLLQVKELQALINDVLGRLKETEE